MHSFDMFCLNESHGQCNLNFAAADQIWTAKEKKCELASWLASYLAIFVDRFLKVIKNISFLLLWPCQSRSQLTCTPLSRCSKTHTKLEVACETKTLSFLSKKVNWQELIKKREYQEMKVRTDVSSRLPCLGQEQN